MMVLLSALVDVTLVLALTLALVTALRSRSAALRHSLLAAAIVVSMSLPVLELVLPQLPVITWTQPADVTSSGLALTSSEAVGGSMVAADTTSDGFAISWPAALLAIWMAGALVTLGGLLTGFVRLARLTARCTPVGSGAWRNIADELSRACRLRRSVTLLQSRDRSLLVTCGVLQPKIILPAGAAEWPDERRRIVLAHELAHVRRHDSAMQILAEMLKALHWFNPLVWLACRRLRQESEYACDDAVLRDGVEGTQYATHLLEVARHAKGRRQVWAPVPAIAEPSTLERRVAAMLNRHRNRAPLTRGAIAAATFAAAALAILLAAADVAPAQPPEEVVVIVDDGKSLSVASAGVAEPQPNESSEAARVEQPAPPAPSSAAPVTPASTVRRSQPAARAATSAAAQLEPATFSGSVLDQTGAVLPGVRLDLTESVTGAVINRVTDGAGRFQFRDLQPSQYQLVASLPGFSTVNNVLTLSSGSSAQRIITMPVGTLQETLTVVCGGQAAASVPVRRGLPSQLRQPRSSMAYHITAFERSFSRVLNAFAPAVAAQEPTQSKPVRVGGNIKAPRKVLDVKPTCPNTFIPATETQVMLTARIGVDGHLSDVRAVPREPGSEPPAEFVESALTAVRQWTFTPTLLNNSAVDVIMNVRVNYKRG